jgi:hypothetical protein
MHPTWGWLVYVGIKNVEGTLTRVGEKNMLLKYHSTGQTHLFAVFKVEALLYLQFL